MINISHIVNPIVRHSYKTSPCIYVHAYIFKYITLSVCVSSDINKMLFVMTAKTPCMALGARRVSDIKISHSHGWASKGSDSVTE